jgi:hypothetical protein
METKHRAVVQLGNLKMRFDLDKLAQLEEELEIESYVQVFQKAGSVRSIRKIVAIGCGVTEDEVNDIDVPINEMIGQVSLALSRAIFGADEPPKVDDKKDDTKLP